MVIVGAMTGRNAVCPEKEWIDSIKAKNIYYKSNIRKLFPELEDTMYHHPEYRTIHIPSPHVKVK
jgi:hypothetical protein